MCSSDLRKIFARFGPDLTGMRFALWGLAFKPRTDDMREAPSRVVVEMLLEAGAAITAYDPEAMGEASRLMGDKVRMADSSLEALDGADALVVVTEWNEFRSPDFEEIKQRLAKPVIFDGRNIYDPGDLRAMGFEYYCIGRGKPQYPG